jgi:hypothetical protein
MAGGELMSVWYSVFLPFMGLIQAGFPEIGPGLGLSKPDVISKERIKL